MRAWSPGCADGTTDRAVHAGALGRRLFSGPKLSADGSFRDMKIDSAELAGPTVLEGQIRGEGLGRLLERDVVEIQVVVEVGEVADVAAGPTESRQVPGFPYGSRRGTGRLVALWLHSSGGFLAGGRVLFGGVCSLLAVASGGWSGRHT
jgi:hypothetical protein